MEVRLLGFLPYEFEDKTGKKVVGGNLYVMYTPDNENCVGAMTAKIGLNEKLLHAHDYAALVGTHIMVSFNMNGKAVGIMPMESKEKK